MNNLELEDNLLPASEGDKAALEKVLSGIISGPLYIPNRIQSHKLSVQPDYPNDFVSIMGIKDTDRVIVPVFTSAELVEKWFGSELLFKSMSGESLFGIIPQDWWICINPGQDVEKDISPWEISRLKHGKDGINEILEEIALDEAIDESIETKPVPEGDFADLKTKLSDYARTEATLEKLYMLLEKSLTTEGDVIEKILIGAECNSTPDGLEKIKEDLRQICGINLIGNLDAKILAGIKGNNILLGVFKNAVPFYQSKSSNTHGILGRLASILRG